VEIFSELLLRGKRKKIEKRVEVFDLFRGKGLRVSASSKPKGRGV